VDNEQRHAPTPAPASRLPGCRPLRLALSRLRRSANRDVGSEKDARRVLEMRRVREIRKGEIMKIDMEKATPQNPAKKRVSGFSGGRSVVQRNK